MFLLVLVHRVGSDKIQRAVKRLCVWGGYAVHDDMTVWVCSLFSHSFRYLLLHIFTDRLMQGPTSSGDVPSPYVKLYLLPDPQKQTKRKTNIARSTHHPTYNEMVSLPVTASLLPS